MKTILVPTDFSLSAENAARYALNLAKNMKLHIKLCHSIMVPAEVPFAVNVSMPMLALDSLKDDADTKIQTAVQRLAALDDMLVSSENFHPLITCNTIVGTVTEMVRQLAKNKDIAFVVLGRSAANGIGHFLAGSTSRELIETVAVPTLLVAADADFFPIKKIAFATDLGHGDISAIAALASFAENLGAEIVLVHINDQSTDVEMISRSKVDSFLDVVNRVVRYDKIQYQSISEANVDDGLEWLVKFGQIELLAMVHKRHNIIYRLLFGSHTHRLRKRVQIPLLVLPPE